MPLLTDIDIVNAAFKRIGEDPIQSFEDDTGGATDASLIYEEVVGFNLGLQPSGFSFAREVRQLSRLDGVTAFTGFLHVFEIPGPVIGLPAYLTDDPSDPGRSIDKYLLSGGQVHADANPLYAMVRFRPDPDKWTDTFRSATITAIASRLAMAVASDRNTAGELERAAYGSPVESYRGGMMRAALAEDAFANPPKRMRTERNPLERAWRS